MEVATLLALDDALSRQDSNCQVDLFADQLVGPRHDNRLGRHRSNQLAGSNVAEIGFERQQVVLLEVTGIGPGECVIVIAEVAAVMVVGSRL